jgi:hypothetical protein
VTAASTVPAWLPIVVSLAALVLAALSLGWNIYKDVVLRARVIVSLGVKMISPENGSDMFDKLMVSAVNYGPGKVRFAGFVQMKNAPLWRRLLRKAEWFVVMSEWDSPYATKLPVLLDVGEELAIVFPYDGDCFLGEPVTDVGLRDSFGRFHWTPRREVRQAIQQFRKDFTKVGGSWKRAIT